MPGVRESCGGDTQAISRDETEITQTFERPPVPPPEPAGPPPSLINDVWPWLGLLGLLAVAGLLVWLFVLRGDHGKGHVVPAVVGLQEPAAIKRLTDDGYDVRSIHQPMKRPRGIVGS